MVQYKWVLAVHVYCSLCKLVYCYQKIQLKLANMKIRIGDMFI